MVNCSAKVANPGVAGLDEKTDPRESKKTTEGCRFENKKRFKNILICSKIYYKASEKHVIIIIFEPPTKVIMTKATTPTTKFP